MLGEPEDTLVARVDDVSIAIDRVSLLVDSLASVIFKVAIFVLDRHDIPVLVLTHDAHDVLDIKPLSLVVVKLWHVAISQQLLAIELLPPEFVDQVASSTALQPSMLVHATTLLVHKEALLGLEQSGEELRSIRLRFLLVGTTLAFVFRAIFCGVDPIKVTHERMGVEIVLLEAEGCRDFPTLVQVRLGEHLLALEVLDDIASGGITQVAALVGWATGLVLDVAFFVLEDDDVALLIAVKISKNILDVEVSALMVWRHLHCEFTTDEILQRLIIDLKLTIIDSG